MLQNYPGRVGKRAAKAPNAAGVPGPTGLQGLQWKNTPSAVLAVMNAVRLEILGPFELVRGGRAVAVPAGAQRLLSLLAVRSEGIHRRAAAEELFLALDRYLSAHQAALAAIVVDPYRETAHRIAIEVHAAEGNIACAVKHYLEYRRLLQQELKVSPSPRMTELIRELTTA